MNKKWLRLLAGNRELVRSVNSYIKLRDKMTLAEWKKNIRPLMQNVQNTINQQLASTTLTDWNMFNLNRINEGVRLTVARFDAQFADELIRAQGELAQVASNFTAQQASLVGLQSPAQALLGSELIETLTPLTSNFVNYFSADMAKVLTGTISEGIIAGKTPFQVASEIKNKFGIDSQQISKLETKKVLLENQFKKGKISKEKYTRQIKTINRKLNSGSIMSYARAERIARTEMMTAASMAQQQIGLEIAEINPEAGKVWLWSHKPTGRVDHQAAETQTREQPVAVNEPFVVAGEQGMFPRSPEFSAGNRINCGCTSVIVNTREGTEGL